MQFHFYLDSDPDEMKDVGWAYPNLDSAKREAAQMAGAMISERGAEIWRGVPWGLTIVEQGGTPVCKLEIVITEASIR